MHRVKHIMVKLLSVCYMCIKGLLHCLHASKSKTFRLRKILTFTERKSFIYINKCFIRHREKKIQNYAKISVSVRMITIQNKTGFFQHRRLYTFAIKHNYIGCKVKIL
ncbi:hypothetical protein V8G54_000607 [Vigna mungo]|uniref:Secreted protein n=1 Tax=Vigna mungo TaxID=3915 RepID=A0AAQ3P5S5_VIGMU